MLTDEKIETIVKAIQKFGVDHQYIQAGEELGELLTKLSQFKRGRVTREDVMEEMADVTIVLDCFKVLLSITNEDLEKKINSQYQKFKGQVDE